MKIGDVVFNNNVRPDEFAVITNVEVVTKEKVLKNGQKKKEVRTKYEAKFDDGSFMTFYGFNIGKSVFKREEVSGQLNLSEFMNMYEDRGIDEVGVMPEGGDYTIGIDLARGRDFSG